MSRVTDFLRSKYPALKDEDEAQLQAFVEAKHPELLEVESKWQAGVKSGLQQEMQEAAKGAASYNALKSHLIDSGPSAPHTPQHVSEEEAKAARVAEIKKEQAAAGRKSALAEKAIQNIDVAEQALSVVENPPRTMWRGMAEVSDLPSRALGIPSVPVNPEAPIVDPDFFKYHPIASQTILGSRGLPETAAQLTSPQIISELALAKHPVSRQAITTLFGKHGVEHGPEAYQEAYRLSKEGGSPEQEAEAWYAALFSTLMAAAPLHPLIPGVVGRLNQIREGSKPAAAPPDAPVGYRPGVEPAQRIGHVPPPSELLTRNIPEPPIRGELKHTYTPGRAAKAGWPEVKGVRIAEPGVPMTLEQRLRIIRDAKATTVPEIRELFPNDPAVRYRADARALLRQAYEWPKGKQPKMPKPPLPKLEVEKKEQKDAIDQQKTTEVHEPVPPQPREGAQPLPVEKSGERVPAPKEARGPLPVEEPTAKPTEKADVPETKQKPQDVPTTPEERAQISRELEQEMPAAQPVEPAAKPEAAAQPKHLTKRQRLEAERPKDILDEVAEKIGKVRGKGSMRPGEKGYYDSEDYKVIARDAWARKHLLSNKKGSSGWDEAAQSAREQGIIPEDWSVGDFEAAWAKAVQRRVEYFKGEGKEKAALSQMEQQKVDFQQKAIKGERDAKEAEAGEPIAVDEMLEGDKFKLAGVEVEVDRLIFNPETTELTGVRLKDGREFGTQTVDAQTVIYPDKGSVKPTERPIEFVPEDKVDIEGKEKLELESVTPEQLKAEEAARIAKAQQAEAEARAKKPLKGDSSDVGQGRLFTEDKDLFGGKTQEEMVGMGAATAGELTPPGRSPIALKNAEIDAARAARGEPPMRSVVPHGFEMVWDRAINKLVKDPAWQDRLLDELRTEMRPVSEVEHMGMLHRKLELQNEYELKARDTWQAHKDGRFSDRDRMSANVSEIEAQLKELEVLGGRGGTGTEAGRSLNIRKAFVNRDFTVTTLATEKLRDKQWPKDGLTKEERLHISDVVEKHKNLQDLLRKIDAEIDAKQLDLGLKDARQRAKRNVRRVREPQSWDTRFTDAVKRLRKRVEDGETNDIYGVVQRLARLFEERGVKDRNDLVDKVHDVLKRYIPEIDRETTSAAIAGYGRFKPLSKDEVSVKLRDHKAQLQATHKLLDMDRDRPPLKSGLERPKPTQEQRRLNRLVNEAKRVFQIPVENPDIQLKSSLDALKTRLENKIADLQDRLANKDYELVKPRPPIARDARAQELEYQLAKVREQWMRERWEDQKAHWGPAKRLAVGVHNSLTLWRAWLTSAEMSGVGRQGKAFMLAHPFRTGKRIPAAFRAFRSEKARTAIDNEIKRRENFHLYNESGLYLAERGVPLNRLEEAFNAELTYRIPGLMKESKPIPIVSGSERAYTTFLNLIRADAFDAMANTLGRGRYLTPEEAKVVANFVNVATGRGALGKNLEGAATALSNVFFAPRYVASRFQFLGMQPIFRGIVKGQGRATKMIAGEYLRMLTGAAVYYGLLSIAANAITGGEAEFNHDITSTDFLKIKMGRTRLDPWAGLQQTFVYLMRSILGHKTTLKGDIVPIRGEDIPATGDDWWDVSGDVVRQKFHPFFGTVTDIATGEHIGGEKVTPKSLARRSLLPITYQDVSDLMRDQGMPNWAILMFLAFFGEGVQTYEQRD